jgi:hypothetical protein
MIENEKKRPQSNHRLPIGTKEQPQNRGKMHRLKGKSTNCEENAQIVFLLRIETTDCEENT